MGTVGNFRLAAETDLPRLREVIDAAYGKYLIRMDRPPAPMLRDLGPSVQSGQCWVLGRPILGLICLVATEDALLVENVAVHPAAQGQGFGRKLMEFADEHACRLGIGRLWLYTNEVMTENLALYAHLGYQETDRRTEDGYRRVFMQKTIRPHGRSQRAT